MEGTEGEAEELRRRLTRLQRTVERELYELKVFGLPSQLRYELIVGRLHEALNASCVDANLHPPTRARIRGGRATVAKSKRRKGKRPPKNSE